MAQPLIVLTGASGRIGSNVHRILLEAGKNVRAVDKARASTSAQPVVRADLLDPNACREIVQSAEVLIHLAYNDMVNQVTNNPGKGFDENVGLNRQLFEAASDAGVKKIIFASSIQVIAKQLESRTAASLPHYLPLDEHSPTEPDNWYALSKLSSEKMLTMLHQRQGIDIIIVRFPPLFHSVPILNPVWFQNRLSEGFSYLSYRDAADLILKLVDAELPGCRVYLPASRKNALGRPAMEMIRDYFPGVPLKKPLTEMGGLVDISTLTRETGWEPGELSEPEPQSPREPGPLWHWRLRKAVLKLVPASAKTFVKRILSALAEKGRRLRKSDR
jgi:nucleoside-diphosphate-sugar epimerase